MTCRCLLPLSGRLQIQAGCLFAPPCDLTGSVIVSACLTFLPLSLAKLLTMAMALGTTSLVLWYYILLLLLFLMPCISETHNRDSEFKAVLPIDLPMGLI
jgi:hypothetical protein